MSKTNAGGIDADEIQTRPRSNAKPFALYNGLRKIHEKPRQIEDLVFSGGGAKGALYPGAYKALYNNGVMKDVQTVSGSSAGSLVAALAACGGTPDDVQKEMDSLNMKALLGHGDKLFGILNKSGDTLETAINRITNRTTLNSIKEIVDRENLSEKQRATLSSIQKKLEENIPDPLTFGDLKELNEIEPDKFKRLRVTAVKKDGGDPVIFDSNDDKYKDVSVKDACRASASIPVLFKPKTIKINGVNTELMDGGMYDNLPVPEGANPEKTLVLAFGEGKDKENFVLQALHGKKEGEIYKPGKREKIKRNYLPEKLAGFEANYKSTDQKEKGFKKLRDKYALSTIMLQADDIKIADFDPAQAKIQQMERGGYFNTMDHLINHDLAKLSLSDTKKYEQQKFAFKVFQKIDNKKGPINLKNVGKDSKEKQIFEYSNHPSDDFVQGFIKLAGDKKRFGKMTGEFSPNTTSMKCLIKTLNEVDTPQSIRKEFATELGVQKDIDHKFKFSEKDFKNFKSQQQVKQENRQQEGLQRSRANAMNFRQQSQQVGNQLRNKLMGNNPIQRTNKIIPLSTTANIKTKQNQTISR